MAAFFASMNKFIIILFLCILSFNIKAQDTLNKVAFYSYLTADISLLTGSYFFLDNLWYKDFKRTNMHWFDDSKEWLLMDKAGHAFMTYQVSGIYNWQLNTTGLSSKKSAILGTALGLSTISIIELLDSKSIKWGASWSDLLANTAGAGFFLAQELMWEEQKILFKFSYHHTPFAHYRPKLLGDNAYKRLMKDYNGQTYWLSTSPYNFGVEWWPSVLNIAIGYGAEGMTGGSKNIVNSSIPYYQRQRQFYLSLDFDLTKIKTSKKWLRTIFSVLNVIKVPMPTIEFRKNNVYGHWLYF